MHLPPAPGPQPIGRPADRTVPCGYRRQELTAGAVAGMGGVVNAVSLYLERGPHTFHSVHVRAAANLAAEARRAGVRHFVHNPKWPHKVAMKLPVRFLTPSLRLAMLQRTRYSALQYGSAPHARPPRGSCPSSGVSKQIRRSSCIGPKKGGSRSRSARPPPDKAARTDRGWCKSRQPSYVRLRSRTAATQRAISHRATWLHPDLGRV